MQPWLHHTVGEDRRPNRRTRPDRAGHTIPTREWIKAWLNVAVNSFGGPAGQISVMHEEIVVRRRWVSEGRFLHALNYCMLLPGPEAQQLASYLGWLLRGTRGGLFAGAVFILPGFLSILGLSILFATYGEVPSVAGLFFGISAAVIAIVANAVRRIGKRVIKNPFMLTIAILSFVGIFFFELPFVVVVGAAALSGVIGNQIKPDAFNIIQPHGHRNQDADVALVDDHHPDPSNRSATAAFGTAARGLLLWFGPLILLAAVRPESIFLDVGRFFSAAAVLTFGGAYSVLAYIAQESVNSFGWLEPTEMTTGLGMAETTPGPLIQVVQFVGFMGSYRNPGSLSPLSAGLVGSVVATWVTFVPSFLWIFLGAPYIERLRGSRTLTSALSTVTAAVVGAVANLAIWFGLFTLFEDVDEIRGYGAVLYEPQVTSLNLAAVAISVGAMVAIFRYRVSTLWVITAAGVAGVVISLSA